MADDFSSDFGDDFDVEPTGEESYEIAYSVDYDEDGVTYTNIGSSLVVTAAPTAGAGVVVRSTPASMTAVTARTSATGVVLQPPDFEPSIKPWLTDTSTSSTLLVRAKISTPFGWLDVNDHKGYELEADTRGTRTVTNRRREVSSPYLAGSWVVDSVPDNITETVSVWVRGNTHYELAERLTVLTDALSQQRFTMSWLIDDVMEQWACQIADYQVATQREFQHAKIAKVVAQVPRYPHINRAQVIPGRSMLGR